MQVLNFFCLNVFKGTKCSRYQIWGPKRFKVTLSLRINARAFIKCFKFLEAIYSTEMFNRRGHLLEVHFLFIRTKFIRTPRLRIGLAFYNISWSTKFELERTLSFKEQIERWILNTISGAGVALALPKLTHKKEHFRLGQELLDLLNIIV